MSYANHIWELLEPLGVYQKSGTFQMGEIQTQGAVLDQVDGLLAELEGEMCLATAEDWGLERVASLFRRRPVASTTKRLRAALAALLRIGGDSFTLEAINDTIAGCGVHALVEENGVPNEVVVSFPNVPGIPKEFEEIKEIIEDILPAHLLITYNFWYITWIELEKRIKSWRDIDSRNRDWDGLETLVLDEDDM